MIKTYTKQHKIPTQGIRQLLLVMRMTTIILMAAIMQVSAASFAQQITLSEKNVALDKIFIKISQQSGYDFLVSSSMLQGTKPVSITVKQADMKEVLKAIFKDQPLDYIIEDKMVMVSRKKDNLSSIAAFQTLDVKGKILDERGEPLVGATVVVKGSTKSVKTSSDGTFTLTNVPSGSKLVITYIGYQQREVEAAREIGTLRLKIAEGALNEVVVSTGYQNLRKVDNAGSIAIVDVERIRVAGETSIDQMLQGVVAGVDVQVASGQVGATPKVRIRGTSTLLGNQEPLWVVDGVIQHDPQPAFTTGPNAGGQDITNAGELRLIASNAISWLNPDDIESLVVLKDASAAAIYGSRAANGVIVVTTKKGKTGPIAVNFTSGLTIGQAPAYKLYKQMNSQQRMQLSREMYDARISFSTPILPVGFEGIIQRLHNKEITQAEFDQQYTKMEQTNTDWFGELFQNPFSQNYSLGISGGTDRLLTRVSVGVMNQRGDAIGNGQLSYTANSNTTFRFNKKLSISFVLNAGSRTIDGFAAGIDPFSYAYNTNRAIPLYDDNGQLYYHEKWVPSGTSTVINGKTSYLYNIKNEIANTSNVNKVKNLGANVDLNWNILPALQYRALIAYTSVNSGIKTYATERAFYSSAIRGYDYGAFPANSIQEQSSRMPFGGMLYTENSLTEGYTVRNSLIFDKDFSNAHRVTVQAGLELTSRLVTGGYNTSYGYLYDRGETFAELPLTRYNEGNINTVVDNDLIRNATRSTRVLNRENNYLSTYTSAIYSYKSRYTINFNGRLDASNRFGQDENKRFLPVWSVAGKWLLANENFAKNLHWLNTFNIYGSYGVQGNSVEEVSPYLIAQNSRLSANYNQYIMSVKSLPYPDLGWEKTISYNLGAEIALFDGRASFMMDIYKKTSDVLSTRDIPFENGAATAVVEGNRMENRGYEFTMNFVPIRTKDFNWQLSINSSVYRNKLVSNGRTNTYTDYLTGRVLLEGQPYSTFYSYALAGLDPNTGIPQYKNFDVPTANPADFLVVSGKSTPDFAGGFNTSIRYKNFTFYAQLAVSFGSEKRLPNLFNTTSNGGLPTPESNAHTDLLRRWQKPGDEAFTNIPSLPGTGETIAYIPMINRVTTNGYVLYNQSDVRVADASFIRARQLALSYEFAPLMLKKMGVKRLNLRLSTTNPFFIDFDDRWNGIDPETGGWPVRRTTSLSVNLNF